MLNTDHLIRCVETLDAALGRLRQAEAGSVDYEIYRNAVVKGFELSLETAGKLLRKAIKAYATQPRDVDAMNFKEVFREAARRTLLEPAEVQRWFAYRDSRNEAAHDYGAAFAEQTLTLLPEFLVDVRAVEAKLNPSMPNLDLPPDWLETVRRLLAAHAPEVEVRAYGSRVNGGCHPGSDLDLIAKGSTGPLSLEQRGAIRAAFEESDLPIAVDVQDWYVAPASFRDVVARSSVIVQAGRNLVLNSI